jgi:hypothetical protein
MVCPWLPVLGVIAFEGRLQIVPHDDGAHGFSRLSARVCSHSDDGDGRRGAGIPEVCKDADRCGDRAAL